MTAQELKNSILQLAVQGKLVPQSAEDEPAVELVKRIIAEKQRHISSGAIKKEKALPPITEDELPFDIPETWAWVRLSDISNITAGGTPSRTISSYWNGDIPWVKISDISDKYVNSTEECITQRGLDNSSAKVFSKGTLLYTIFATIGTVGILNIDAATNQAIAGVTFYGEYDLDYMYYVAVGLKDLLVAKGKGMAQMNINQTILKSTPIPIPPLAEQRRIVAKIEELLPLIEEYDEAEQKLSTLNANFPEMLRKSILQQAISGKLTERDPSDEPASELLKHIQAEKAKLIAEGKMKKEKRLPVISNDDQPFDIPETWTWSSIAETCTNIQYGTSEKSAPSGKVAVLRMGNLQGGKIDYSNLVYTSNDYDIERCHLEYNDLLFNRTNSKELVGKTAIYKAEIPAIYAGYLIRVTPILIDSDYLNYVMQSHFFKKYCLAVKTDAIGQSNINAEKLKRFVFPLPPLAEQKRIVAKLEEILPLCERLK